MGDALPFLFLNYSLFLKLNLKEIGYLARNWEDSYSINFKTTTIKLVN